MTSIVLDIDFDENEIPVNELAGRVKKAVDLQLLSYEYDVSVETPICRSAKPLDLFMIVHAWDNGIGHNEWVVNGEENALNQVSKLLRDNGPDAPTAYWEEYFKHMEAGNINKARMEFNANSSDSWVLMYPTTIS